MVVGWWRPSEEEEENGQRMRDPPVVEDPDGDAEPSANKHGRRTSIKVNKINFSYGLFNKSSSRRKLSGSARMNGPSAVVLSDRISAFRVIGDDTHAPCSWHPLCGRSSSGLLRGPVRSLSESGCLLPIKKNNRTNYIRTHRTTAVIKCYKVVTFIKSFILLHFSRKLHVPLFKLYSYLIPIN